MKQKFIIKLLAVGSLAISLIVFSVPGLGYALTGDSSGNHQCTIYAPDSITVMAGGSSQIYVDGTDSQNSGSIPAEYGGTTDLGSIDITSVAGPISASKAFYGTTDDNGNVQGALFSVTGNSVGTGTIDISYGDNSCNADAQVAVTVVAGSGMKVWDGPGSSGPLVTTEEYPNAFQQDLNGQPYYLQQGSQNTGDIHQTTGMSTSGQEPIPSNYVICGVRTGGDGNTFQPIACPIDPAAVSAGFSWTASSRWVADSDKSYTGPIYCTTPSQNNGGGIGNQMPATGYNNAIMDGVAQWGDRSNGAKAPDMMDCALMNSASGITLQPSSLYTIITASNVANVTVYCPSDSIVVGAPYNESNDNTSVNKFGCAKVLFSAPTPAPILKADPSNVVLGSSTTLSWDFTSINAANAVNSSGSGNQNSSSASSGSNNTSGSNNNTSQDSGSGTVSGSSNVSGGGGGSGSGGSGRKSSSAMNFIPTAFAAGNTTGSNNGNGPCTLQGSGVSGAEGLSLSGKMTVIPTAIGSQIYTMSCTDDLGKPYPKAVTVTVLAPPGTVNVKSMNAATGAPLSSSWTFTTPAGSSLSNCNGSSDCTGTSSTNQNQPAGTYTISNIPNNNPQGYAFDENKSNSGSTPLSQSITTGNQTISFNLYWDPIASIGLSADSVTLSSASPEATVNISNNGTSGSTLDNLSASVSSTVPGDNGSWLTLGSLSGDSLSAGGSSAPLSISVSNNSQNPPPSACAKASGCTVNVTISGTSDPGSNSVAPKTFSVTYHAPISVTLLANGHATTTTLSGQNVSLTWTSENVQPNSCTAKSSPDPSQWSGNKANVNASGDTVAPTADNADTTYTYMLSCTGYDGGRISSSANVTVVPPPASCTFSANPPTILQDQTSTLSWDCQHATGCTLNGQSVGTSGTMTVSPTSTAPYNLVCPGPGGSASTTINVSVQGVSGIHEIAP